MSLCFTHFSLRKAQHVESAASIVKQYPVKGVVCVPVPQSSIKLDLRCYLITTQAKAGIINILKNRGVESHMSFPVQPIILMLLIQHFYHKCIHVFFFLVGILYPDFAFVLYFSNFCY